MQLFEFHIFASPSTFLPTDHLCLSLTLTHTHVFGRLMKSNGCLSFSNTVLHSGWLSVPQWRDNTDNIVWTDRLNTASVSYILLFSFNAVIPKMWGRPSSGVWRRMLQVKLIQFYLFMVFLFVLSRIFASRNYGVLKQQLWMWQRQLLMNHERSSAWKKNITKSLRS